MGITPNHVYLPTPDQSATTGAVASAPTTTAAVEDARTPLGSDWTTGGYVDENGVTMNVNRSMTPIRDWSLSMVRNALTEYTGSISFGFLQVDEFSAKTIFGEDNVTTTDATATAGAGLKIAIGANMPEIKSFCFSMKDGNSRIRIYIPRGQVTEVGEVSFVPGAGNVYPSTLSTYDDGTGHSIYVIYDDGQVVSG